ncbi:MAG: toxic anion resistance protein [Bifidobacteriaceae bacterium]|jgi:uncharacterized protein YaaN involved in tellurite resistance|nr:toxic anion resistance protein [Bifidobacteriaceae bacterium]
MTSTTASPDPVAVDMASLLGDPKANPVAESPLAKALASVPPDEAVAEVPQAHLEFRSLLAPDQRELLAGRGVELANRLLADRNALLDFGQSALAKVNQTSSELLAAQRDIELPEADQVVNGILRQLDGFSAQFESGKVKGLMNKLRHAMRSGKSTLKAMYRESKSIEQRLDAAAGQTRQLELRLADNVSRGQQLYKANDDSLTGLVGVLAALEQVREEGAKRAAEMEARLASTPADDPGRAGLEEEAQTLAEAIQAVELTLFDWRQQFFLAYALSPAVRNLIGVSFTMQRRLQVFRTMGLPGGKKSLVMWQQAALAKESGEVGQALADGTARLIEGAFQAAGQAVAETAKAAQAPILPEQAIWTIRDSIKAQCDGLVEASRWGRAVRGQLLTAMETSEREIGAAVTEARTTIVREVLADVQSPTPQAPTPDADILQALGVK